MTPEIEAATIGAIVELRADALRHRVSALKVWKMLGERVLLATRSSLSVQEWLSRIQRKLRIENPSSWSCSAQRDLVATVGGRDEEWLRWLSHEHGYVMAMARLAIKDRKARRAEETEDAE